MTAVLAASAALLAVWVLPGFAVRWAASRLSGGPGLDPGQGSAALMEALVAGAMCVALLGGTLIAFGWFSAAGIGVPLLALAILGVPPFVAWLRTVVQPFWRTAALLVAAFPAIWSGAQDGLHPAHSFQWFYWELGTQLSAAGGVPEWVLEYGQRIRWHPDYVFFTAGSEAYRWLTSGIGEASAVVAWRAPVAALGLLAVYAVLRLWVTRVPAVLGTAAVSATTFFLIKFNAYKPESLGLVIGLACVCVLIHGVRRSRHYAIVIGLVGLAADFGIHGIAAAVCSALALAALGAEWRVRGGRSARPWPWRPLVAGGIAAAVVLVATGLALQGRAVVATDAAHPQETAEGDPTWTFLQRHDAEFAVIDPPPLASRIRDSVSSPWPSTVISKWGWAPLGLVLLAPVAIALRGPPRLRGGSTVLAVWLGLLALAAAFFALAFDTFIPQHTGITRIGAYIYLLWGMAVALVAEAVAPAVARSATRVAVAAIVAFMLAWSVPVAGDSFSRGLKLPPVGEEALAELGDRAGGGPRSAVLGNASTRGLVEFATGFEQPIEGRQPVIEDPEFLAAANRVLERTQAYFMTLGEPAATSDLPRRLDVGHVLLASRPELLGARDAFGTPETAIESARREPGLRPVWRRPGVALFEVREPPPALTRQGPVELGRWPIWTILLALAAAFAVFGASATIGRSVGIREHAGVAGAR